MRKLIRCRKALTSRKEMAPLVVDGLRHRKKGNKMGTAGLSEFQLSPWCESHVGGHWKLISFRRIWHQNLVTCTFVQSLGSLQALQRNCIISMKLPSAVVQQQWGSRGSEAASHTPLPHAERVTVHYCHPLPQDWTSRLKVTAASATGRGCQHDGWRLKKSICQGSQQKKTKWEPDSPPLTPQDYTRLLSLYKLYKCPLGT